jgi:phosphoenolpyruvate carboxylase
MGGDRDGNPYVTATCTRDSVYLARLQATTLYFKAIEQLIFDLAMWRCSASFRKVVDDIVANRPHEEDSVVFEIRRGRNYTDFWKTIPENEPYRVLLGELRDKLYETMEQLQKVVADPSIELDLDDGSDRFIRCKEDLSGPLMHCYESLMECGDEQVANGYLLDVIRQVQCFGLNLVKLDI